jgi:Xaa-Pro aminopeptidase
MKIASRHGVSMALVLASSLPGAGAARSGGGGATGPAVDHARIRRDRIERLLPAILAEQGIDAWLTFTRENTPDPILPVLGIDHIVARGAFLFARKDGAFRRIAVAASYDVDPIKNSGLYDEVIAYKSEGIKPHLKQVLDDLAPRQIAVNFSRDVTIADGLTAGLRAYLEEAVPEHARRFVSSERLVVSLLGRKLPEEIAALERAAICTQQILAEALSSERVRPGVTTERALDDWMRARAEELGCGVAFGSIVVGPSRGHSDPTDRVIQRGDLLRTDWGASYEG